MAKIVAQGQITIVDMHDMPPVQGRLTSNQPKIVVLSSNGATQTPNWETNNLIVRAELFKAGDSSDLVAAGNTAIKGITWFYTLGSAAETTTAPTGVTPSKDGSSIYNNKITVSKRLLSVSAPSLKIRAVVDFEYSGVSQKVPVSVEIDFALANNGVAGQNSYSAFLTNTSAMIPCSYSGTVSQSGGVSIGTTAMVYEGGVSKAVTLSTTPKTPLPSGVTITVGANAASVNINFAANANMGNADSGTITLVATCNTKTFDLVFSWSKSKQGNAGQNSSSYWLIPSASALVKKWNGSAWIYVPSAISVSAKTQTGTSNATDYNSRFKIQLYNGSTAITDSGYSTTSSADGASLSLTIPTGKVITHATLTLYKAGGTSIILDEEKVMVVEEPRKVVSVGVYAEKDDIRNGSGTAILRVKVYKDGTDVSASASKKWMKGASTGSIGTGETITVSAADVPAHEIFRCQVTIDGSVYLDSIVLNDPSDPIQVDVTSTAGTVFKNGQGSTDVSAKLWRNGENIDEPGTMFGYSWYKLKQDGTEDAAWAPVPKVAPDLAKAGPSITTTTAAISGSTVTVGDVTYLKKGVKVFLGAVATVYEISAVDVATKKLTFTAAPSAVASGSSVKLINYKTIVVSNREVDEKAQFLCRILMA